MPPSGDDPQTWEVWRSPASRNQVDRYRPPAKGRPDPVTLVGGPDKPLRRFKRLFWVAAMGVPYLALLKTWVAPSIGLPIAICLGISLLASIIVVAKRHPVWQPPEVTVNGENLTVTDVAGITRTAAWSDVDRLVLAPVVVGFTDELHLTWVLSDGTGLTTNLGNTLDLHEVQSAIESRAPEGLKIQVLPRRAISRSRSTSRELDP